VSGRVYVVELGLEEWGLGRDDEEEPVIVEGFNEVAIREIVSTGQENQSDHRKDHGGKIKMEKV
jgi:hypothetical protein